jgi:precorrin-2 dehydrogenase/sirohydrochlorin ferrochelatase
MRAFPIFLDLRGLACLVVGGGPVGARRAGGLAAAGARVRMVAPEFGAAARALARRGSVRLERRAFRVSDLRGCVLAIAATGDARVDGAIARAARRRRIPCNVPGDPERGTFTVPAVVRRGALVLAVSTGGASPTLARRMAQDLARRAASARGPILRILRAARRELRLRVQDPAARRRALRRLARAPLEALAGAGRIAEARARARSVIEAAVGRGRRREKNRDRFRRL